MLDCRFSFEAYTKNVRENGTQCFLKTSEVLLDADGHFFFSINATKINYTHKHWQNNENKND